MRPVTHPHHMPGRFAAALAAATLFTLAAFLSACATPRPPRPLSTAQPIVADTATPTALPTQPEIIPTPAFTPTPTATPACTNSEGSLQDGIIDTRLLAKPMSYVVYLPPCYGADPAQRYPVLYLLHGQNFDETQWLRIGAPEAADQLISGGEAPPFIMVFPYDYAFKQPTEYRFEEVFTDLLIPQIDSAYSTMPNRAYRAIGGLSRGGAWAIRIGSRRPELFSIIGGHSPAVFYVDLDTLPARLLSIPEEQRPTFYVDAGDSDVELETAQKFVSLLNRLDVSHEWHFNIGFHNEAYWSAHVTDYLRWYTQTWK